VVDALKTIHANQEVPLSACNDSFTYLVLGVQRSSLLMKTHGRKSGLDEISDWGRRTQQARYRVKSLALSCGCTPRQLERYFAKHFGITPHSWIDQLRLRDVRARLHSGELPKNLTQEVGFTHPPQLSFWCRRVSGQRLKGFAGVKVIRSHFRKINVLPSDAASRQMGSSARITKSNHP